MSDATIQQVLPDGLPRPVPAGDGLDKTYWEGTRRHELWVQHCAGCGTWQWGPEWICHHCHTFDVAWERVGTTGVIYAAVEPQGDRRTRGGGPHHTQSRSRLQRLVRLQVSVTESVSK